MLVSPENCFWNQKKRIIKWKIIDDRGVEPLASTMITTQFYHLNFIEFSFAIYCSNTIDALILTSEKNKVVFNIQYAHEVQWLLALL